MHHGGVTQHRLYEAIPKSDDLIGRESRVMFLMNFYHKDLTVTILFSHQMCQNIVKRALIMVIYLRGF